MESSIKPVHWSHLDALREAVTRMYADEILADPAMISKYDQIMAAGREALESRGMDLEQDEQRYIVACTIEWVTNIIAGVLLTHPCIDKHALAHVRNAISWPSYVLREILIDLPLPTKFEEEENGLPEV